MDCHEGQQRKGDTRQRPGEGSARVFREHTHLPVAPEEHILGAQPLLLDEPLDASADDAPLEVLLVARLVVGRALVIRVVLVVGLVDKVAVPPCAGTPRTRVSEHFHGRTRRWVACSRRAYRCATGR